MRLFHSFPRITSRDKEEELELGWQILISVLDLGLLLTHERITYPVVRSNDVDTEFGSFVDQLRCCFTLLDEKELLDHASVFGAFSLEFVS